ncbi:MAG: cupin domain-containing protein [Anaerolineae bacterium]|nr:cupin domain-containing protein [Anaerolineae bacterium]MEB2289308.1 cupin domain-containing protein [Anaerolineae bacterium]
MSEFVFFEDLAALLAEIQPDSIVSRTLHGDGDVKAVLFGFDTGQELSEHTAALPASIFVLRGEAELSLGGERRQAGPGTWVHMPPNLPHTVVARSPLIMLLLLYRRGGEK